MQYEVEILVGEETRKYVDFVAQQRIATFRDFPYLYAGNLQIETKYLTSFANDSQSLFIVLKNGNEVIAFVTGLPLSSDVGIVDGIRKIVTAEKSKVADYYYLGEAMVMPKYRGEGLLRVLLDNQEKQLKQWGFKKSCLLTVVRQANHPLKPANYLSSDLKFAHFGYVKTQSTLVQQWPTIQMDGAVKDDKNTLAIWEKDLHI